MYLDLFLLILLVWAILSGWRHGFIKELIHTGGVLGGLVLAAVLYVVLGHWLTVDGSEANQVLSIIAFLILCIIMPLALGFVASSLTTMVRGMRLGLPNSLLGSAVSVVKFALLISFALNMMGNLNPPPLRPHHRSAALRADQGRRRHKVPSAEPGRQKRYDLHLLQPPIPTRR